MAGTKVMAGVALQTDCIRNLAKRELTKNKAYSISNRMSMQGAR